MLHPLEYEGIEKEEEIKNIFFINLHARILFN